MTPSDSLNENEKPIGDICDECGGLYSPDFKDGGTICVGCLKEKNKSLEAKLHAAEEALKVLQDKYDRNDRSLNADVVHAQVEMDEAREELKKLQVQFDRARVYQEWHSWACPLCFYKDGVFQNYCTLHEKIHGQESKITSLSDLIKDCQKALELANEWSAKYPLGGSQKMAHQADLEAAKTVFDHSRDALAKINKAVTKQIGEE